MIEVPHTYAAWIKILDILASRENDIAVLEAMRAGNISWQSGIAERFTKKLGEVLELRMNGAVDRFQKRIVHARNINGLSPALITLRKELAFLVEVVGIDAIPQEVRGQYISLIYDQADRIQDSLENSAKNDRSGKESSILRTTKVNAFVKR